MKIHIFNGYLWISDNLYKHTFFLGDRLTDERVQGAQKAMCNEDSAKERLEGFISKTEDFHRLMNFLEVKILTKDCLFIAA
jgi:hypothetical protein